MLETVCVTTGRYNFIFTVCEHAGALGDNSNKRMRFGQDHHALCNGSKLNAALHMSSLSRHLELGMFLGVGVGPLLSQNSWPLLIC